MRRIIATLSLVLFVIVSVFLLNFVLFLVTPYRKTEGPISLVIEPGMRVDEILKKLSEEGLVSNPVFFELYLKARGFDRKIRAGDYQFDSGVSPHQMVSLLLKGDFARLRITILEGWTAREIAKFLEGQGLVRADEFLQKAKDLEGYLFPDTYEMYQPKGAEEIVQKMVGHFHEVFNPSLQARAREVGLSDYEVLILASIVEKETGNREEQPLVASVFLNRLKRKMGLASDPTVIYGIPNFNGNLTRADLERPSPYNTYLNAGLPPTPICNPGLASIRAVLYPAETDFLYFVSKNDGTHQFSKTSEEHYRAVMEYQRSQ
ncbi:MAG: endolytic transglycosylase MltG [Deltaproteobacteria bacterium]|nr:endolytic transglycosylase MltG [Deltaproteobacteria bacterium]